MRSHLAQYAVDVRLVGTDWWANLSIITAGVLAALVAALVAIGGYRHQKAAARRERCAEMYATAVQAVENYLEGPYRVRRRDGSVESRNALTDRLSDIKSSIEYHQTLLRIHGSEDVASAYAGFVEAARADAGAAMTDAWHQPATHTDADVPLMIAMDRSTSDAARARLIRAMKDDLSSKH
ncbi:MAG: hypothetical protein ACYC90_00330 [Candidatus Nanopelagicales bacterium]